jgi:hypothetical protein
MKSPHHIKTPRQRLNKIRTFPPTRHRECTAFQKLLPVCRATDHSSIIGL